MSWCLVCFRTLQKNQKKPQEVYGLQALCGKTTVRFFGGPNEPPLSAGVRVQLERLSRPTRVINVASHQGFPCAVCVCVCVHSIIGPVGDGGSCGHKPTWNFLNKGLIFTGSCAVLEGVSSLSLINLPTDSHHPTSGTD